MEIIQRKIREQKFYATLPTKLDKTVEEYKKEVPEEDPELDWKFEEVGEFGQDGWTISYSHKSKQHD